MDRPLGEITSDVLIVMAGIDEEQIDRRSLPRLGGRDGQALDRLDQRLNPCLANVGLKSRQVIRTISTDSVGVFVKVFTDDGKCVDRVRAFALGAGIRLPPRA